VVWSNPGRFGPLVADEEGSGSQSPRACLLTCSVLGRNGFGALVVVPQGFDMEVAPRGP